MPKVLYITYDGMTDPLGRSQVLPYLSGLSGHGYEIHILSFEKKEAMKREGAVVRKLISGSGLHWHPQNYSASPPVLSTIRDLRTMKGVAFRLHAQHQFQIVHARSYISALAALKLKHWKGVRFVFDMRGFWADERVDGFLWNLKNPLFRAIYRFFKTKEKAFLREADAVVSLTHAALPHLERIADSSTLSVTVIPCCADLDHFHPDSVDENRKELIRREFGLSRHDQVLSYLGSLGTWYMSCEMFEFFRHAKNEGVFDKLLIVSRDDRERVLNQAVESGIEPEDIVVVAASREEIPALISVSAANVFFIRPCFSKTASSPTKFAEVLGMGVPVIANAGVGDIETQIRETGSGYVLSELTSLAMEALIKELKAGSMPSAEICRNAALKYFDLKQGVEKYREIYERVLKDDA